MTKNSRLNALYERLKRANGLSMSALAAEFGVSVKTLQRDFNALRNFGAYKVGRLLFLDAKRAKDDLSGDERVIVGILTNLAKSNGKDFYLKAKPLLTRLTQQIEQPIFINQTSESLNDKDLANFEFIEQCITRCVELGFEYHGKTYAVKPFKLGHFEDFWYLLGLDTRDNDCFKKFYFKEISHLQDLGRHFTLDEDIEKRIQKANSVWFNLDEPFFVQLLIDAKMAKYFKRRVMSGATLIEQSDKSVILELEIAHTMQIKPLIYKFIPHIRVLEPVWLNESLKNELLDYAKSL